MQLLSLLSLLCLLGGAAADDSINVVVDISRGNNVPPLGARAPINQAFVGFSVEWTNLHVLIDSPPQFNVTLNLLQHFTDATGIGPVLRVGGGTSDTTWYGYHLPAFLVPI